MTERRVTVTLTQAQADHLWSLADMAGNLEDTGFTPSEYAAGRRAMDALKRASHEGSPVWSVPDRPDLQDWHQARGEDCEA